MDTRVDKSEMETSLPNSFAQRTTTNPYLYNMRMIVYYYVLLTNFHTMLVVGADCVYSFLFDRVFVFIVSQWDFRVHSLV